jgi:hypothetical protein
MLQCTYCQKVAAQCCGGDAAQYQIQYITCDLCVRKLRALIGKIPDEAVAEKKSTCCLMRRKVVVVPAKVLPEEACGVPDSELVDYLIHTHDSPGGKPILAIKFCPWCGTERDPGGETRVSEIG